MKEAKLLYSHLFRSGHLTLASYLLKKMIRFKNQGHFWVGMFDNLSLELGGYCAGFSGYNIFFDRLNSSKWYEKTSN